MAFLDGFGVTIVDVNLAEAGRVFWVAVEGEVGVVHVSVSRALVVAVSVLANAVGAVTEIVVVAVDGI